MKKFGKFNQFIILALIALLSACASPSTRPGDGGITGDDTGPADPNRPRYAYPKRIALVLGGAGVASFATVGLLKKLQEEGIEIEFIVSTGWPTLFSLGHGFLKSVHDLEWFAMRLEEKDFFRAGLFEIGADYASHDRLSELIENSFKQSTLNECRVPLVIAATNTDIAEPEIYSSGPWKEPLLKTMSVPGLFRPYPEGGNTQWISSVRGMDVEEAVRRGARTVVAVEMYDDYLNSLRTGKKDSGDDVFRRLYHTRLSKSVAESMGKASVAGRINLRKGPRDFSAKRSAILAGYKEGARIVRELKNSVPSE